MQDGPSAAAALSLSSLVLSLPSLVLNPISLVSNPPFLVSKASGDVRTGSVNLHSHIGLTSDMTSATLSLLPTPATVLLALPAGCLHLPVSCVYSPALATLKTVFSPYGGQFIQTFRWCPLAGCTFFMQLSLH